VRFVVLLSRLLVFLLVIAVAVPLFVGGRIWLVARDDDRRPSEVILVLGAAQFDGRPSSIFEARLVHARNLYQDGVAPLIMTVGGSAPGDRLTEASAGRDYLVGVGVPAEDVVAVEVGRDTLQSVDAAAERMEQLGLDTAVIVTDPWHALRTRTMARDEGIDAVASPTRRGPAVRTRETQVRYIARETLGLIYYRIFGDSVAEGPDAL
jgi:vancomycin permeability regulator SanA